MSVEANKLVVREFFSAMSNGDPEGAFAVLAADVVWTIIGDTPVSKTFRGLKDLEEKLLNEVHEIRSLHSLSCGTDAMRKGKCRSYIGHRSGEVAHFGQTQWTKPSWVEL